MKFWNYGDSRQYLLLLIVSGPNVNVTSPTPKRKNPRGKTQNWTKMNVESITNFFKDESNWKVSSTKRTLEGKKVYYYCPLGVTCKSQIYIWYEENGSDHIFQNNRICVSISLALL